MEKWSYPECNHGYASGIDEFVTVSHETFSRSPALKHRAKREKPGGTGLGIIAQGVWSGVWWI